jgi:hypothetical protein
MAETFPTEVTPSEVGYGFGVEEIPTGVRVVMAHLTNGLRAVKVKRADGTIEYVVTDEKLQPLYIVAKSVDELRARFPR